MEHILKTLSHMVATKVVSVCLLELKKRCTPSDLKKFQQFVAKRDQYVDRLRKLEESGARGQLPPIDWEFYKRNVRAEAVSLVEEFERKYTSLTVPYPEDLHSPKLEEMKKQVKKDLQEFVDESNCRIVGYQREIERISNLLPFNQMTWEDYIAAYPGDAPNFIKNPTFWPHNPSEQIGYEDEEQVADSKPGVAHKQEGDTKKVEAKKNEPKV